MIIGLFTGYKIRLIESSIIKKSPFIGEIF